jgi:hypothetical protein
VRFYCCLLAVAPSDALGYFGLPELRDSDPPWLDSFPHVSRTVASSTAMSARRPSAAEGSRALCSSRSPRLSATPRSWRSSEARFRLGPLTPDERTALILAGAGYSYPEIGAGRDWSQTKVKRCVYEGRASLREGDGWVADPDAASIVFVSDPVLILTGAPGADRKTTAQ